MARNKGHAKIFYASDEMHAAVQKHTEATGEAWSDIVRKAVAAYLKMPKLAEPPPSGRPRSPVKAATEEVLERLRRGESINPDDFPALVETKPKKKAAKKPATSPKQRAIDL